MLVASIFKFKNWSSLIRRYLNDMSKTHAKARKPQVTLTPHQIICLQTDYRNGVSREKIISKYKISIGSYYKYVKPEKERMLRAALDGKRDVDNNNNKQTTDINVNVMAGGGYGIAYNEMNVKSANYLKGMALTFGLTEAEILDDIVNLALDLGAMEIHGKK